jgi:hypothetical protein
MARKKDITTKLLAVIPALLGIGAGLISALQPENVEKIQIFFSNPLNVGILTSYAAVVISIVTVILFQVVLSARNTDREEIQSEPPLEPEASPSETPPVLTPEQLAARQKERNLVSIRSAFSRNRRRMIEEKERIQRNGFLNLLIGILFSIVALGVLGYPLFTSNAAPATDWINIVERFAPRMSLGILIQLIGFFFLRLYVRGENEIQYIRNEITNFESRLIAYYTATTHNDATAMRDFAKQLVRTERNFKLGKGERSLYSVDATYNDLGQLLKMALPRTKVAASHE